MSAVVHPGPFWHGGQAGFDVGALLLPPTESGVRAGVDYLPKKEGLEEDPDFRGPPGQSFQCLRARILDVQVVTESDRRMVRAALLGGAS